MDCLHVQTIHASQKLPSGLTEPRHLPRRAATSPSIRDWVSHRSLLHRIHSIMASADEKVGFPLPFRWTTLFADWPSPRGNGFPPPTPSPARFAEIQCIAVSPGSGTRVRIPVMYAMPCSFVKCHQSGKRTPRTCPPARSQRQVGAPLPGAYPTAFVADPRLRSSASIFAHHPLARRRRPRRWLRAWSSWHCHPLRFTFFVSLWCKERTNKYRSKKIFCPMSAIMSESFLRRRSVIFGKLKFI